MQIRVLLPLQKSQKNIFYCYSALLRGILLSIIMSSLFFPRVLAADETDALKENQKTKFIVTAYYSPLPNQKEYVRGSYENDKILQGEGIKGANNIDVYVGMIAAPKKYKFGTRIWLNGLGTGTVQDRGGAIVAAGERKHNYDRLDVWMGYGDDGRERALNWGKREVEGMIINSLAPDNMNFTVLPREQAINTEISSTQFPISSTSTSSRNSSSNSSSSSASAQVSNSSSSSASAQVSNSNIILQKGAKGEKVKNLQDFLKREGFFEGTSTGYYGPRTEESLIKFQKFHNIITSDLDNNAGIYTTTTQEKVNEVWIKADALKEHSVDITMVPAGIGRGDSGKKVKRLQIIMKNLGYFDEIPNGVYGPKTQESITLFQKENNIISSPTDLGAGYFGPQTSKILSFQLLEKRKYSKTEYYFYTKKVSIKELAKIKIERKTKISASNSSQKTKL